MLSKNEKARRVDRALDRIMEPDVPVEPGRIDRLVQVVDHCIAAKAIADAMGEGFLSHMLSMSIQAARSEMVPKRSRAGN